MPIDYKVFNLLNQPEVLHFLFNLFPLPSYCEIIATVCHQMFCMTFCKLYSFVDPGLLVHLQNVSCM